MIAFDIVVAIDASRGIGRGGKLPWDLSGDMRHFREITRRTKDPSKRNAVIMGRKTWDSVPVKFRPLAGRLNVVITRNADLQLPEGVIKASGLDDALTKLRQNKWKETIEKIFVIGGEQIFRAAIDHPACRRIHLTHIEQKFDCDTFFPEFRNRFSTEHSRSPRQQEGLYSYVFIQYEK
jgi:dihydrofolate reductase/thymidylate synthase